MDWDQKCAFFCTCEYPSDFIEIQASYLDQQLSSYLIHKFYQNSGIGGETHRIIGHCLCRCHNSIFQKIVSLVVPCSWLCGYPLARWVIGYIASLFFKCSGISSEKKLSDHRHLFKKHMRSILQWFRLIYLGAPRLEIVDRIFWSSWFHSCLAITERFTRA
jgi:hypothetical protein